MVLVEDGVLSIPILALLGLLLFYIKDAKPSAALVSFDQALKIQPLKPYKISHLAVFSLIHGRLVKRHYGMHTYYTENQLIRAKISLNASCLCLNVSCLPDGIRPHQVRFARVHALPSTQKGQYSGKAHLMRTDPVRKTTQPKIDCSR